MAFDSKKCENRTPNGNLALLLFYAAFNRAMYARFSNHDDLPELLRRAAAWLREKDGQLPLRLT